MVIFQEDTVSSHEIRRIRELKKWSGLRELLVNVAVEESCLLPGTICMHCQQTEATVRCNDCGPRQFFCLECSKSLHKTRNIFHILQLWTNGMFVPLFPNHEPLKLNGHNCFTQETRTINCIDKQGRNHHYKFVTFCQCESAAETLVRLNLWPGSPERPSCAFDCRLMDFAEQLFIHCKVSLKEFSETLDIMRPLLQPKLVSSIYSILNSGCFEEYRFFKHQLRYMLLKDCPELFNGTECPTCPKTEGVLIESMDACFGLSRKKAQGEGVGMPKHQNGFFADQDDVDNFVNNYNETAGASHVDHDCSQFHAGEVLPALRSKGKNKLLDEKGIFGRVCRHDFPKGFLSIKHGERIAYSVYEMQRIKESLLPNIKLVVMYDIACILDKHIKNNHKLAGLQDVPLAIPIFHCYGHKSSCQVQFSPRRTAGIGLTDGEGTERLWAFLRDFSRITKEMSPQKRIDSLSDGLLHYGRELIRKMVTTELLPIQEWMQQELNAVLPVENVLAKEWDEEYVELIEISKTLRNDVRVTLDEEKNILDTQRKLNRNEKTLTNIEKQNGVRKRWTEADATFHSAKKRLTEKSRTRLLMRLHKLASERAFLLEMKRKYADGQAIAIKLSKQVNKATVHLQKTLVRLNATTQEDGQDDIAFNDVKDPSSDVYANLSLELPRHDIPYSVRKRIIELDCLKKRCEEENSMVNVEMKRLVSFYETQITLISSHLDQLNSRTASPYSSGLINLLLTNKTPDI
ncbi:hypothetical protein QZH41_017010 [Actinostola sp. cb2023]|nr:hypothetical protein QZH41_017010 [Actinostola sp. cb2023]